nr:Uma2 family endonuclease [Acidithiobacillus montserratensis]
MTIQAGIKPVISVADYLENEQLSEIKHEYL